MVPTKGLSSSRNSPTLAREVDGETELLRLFQPSVQTKRLFKIFIATLSRDSNTSRIRHAISAAFAEYRTVGVGTAVLTLLLLGAMPGWWIALQDRCDFKNNLPLALSQIALFFVSIATAGLLGILFGGIALALMVFRDVGSDSLRMAMASAPVATSANRTQ